MRVNLTSDEWTTVEVPAGTLQNLSPTAAIEIVEENEDENNSGLVLYPRQKFAYSNNVIIKARSVWDTNIDSTQDVILAIEPIVSATGGGGGGGGMTTLSIGSTTTGAPGTPALVTNSGTATSVILNFTIPKGEAGRDGTTFTISGMYPTYADMVTANPNPVAGEAHFVGTADDNTVYFWDTDKTPANWTDAGPIKGVKGDAGSIEIVSVETGATAGVENVGTTQAAKLKIVLPAGGCLYMRQNATAYAPGDVAYSALLPSNRRLVCVTGGVSGATEPTYTTTPGDYISDGNGTLVWMIEDIDDGTPVGRVVFDGVLRDGYIKGNGATVATASAVVPRLITWLQSNPTLLATGLNDYEANIGKYLYDSGSDALTLPAFTPQDVPIGTVIQQMGNAAPVDYVSCNGALLNIDSKYNALAEYIKVQFGTYNYFGGDGTTTFAVPDLRGEFLRGTGTNSHTDQGSGYNVGVHQDGTKIPNVNKAPASAGIQVNTAASDATTQDVLPLDADKFSPRTGYITVSSTNSDFSSPNNYGPYTTRPTNTSVLYCIKYRSQPEKLIPQIRY